MADPTPQNGRPNSAGEVAQERPSQERPNQASAREAPQRLAPVPDPDDDEKTIIGIFAIFRPAEARELTREDARRVIDLLRRRAPEPITDLRKYAYTPISRDVDAWLRVARGQPAS